MPASFAFRLPLRLQPGIRVRMLLVGLISLIGFFVLTGIAMRYVRQQMIEDRVTKIRHLAEVGQGILQQQYQRFRAGEISEPSAKKFALETLRGMRYGNNEYFFVDDFDCNSVLLPNIPTWEGKNFTQKTDSNGHYFVQSQRDTAMAGGGTVYYRFPKDDSEKSVDKASYVLPFFPWNWLIGTGIYLDEVDREIREILFRFLADCATVGLVAGLLITQISRGITRPLKRLTDVIRRLTNRDYAVHIDSQERSDEIGDIARALEVFKLTGHQFEALQEELRQKDAAAAQERAAWLEQQRESAVRLEQSSRLITVGELATSLAHELNQPLAAITNYCRGCVSLLEGGQVDPKELLEPMRKATEQAILAARIVTRIRSYLRRSEPSLDAQDLQSIIIETVGLIEPDAQRQGLRIALDLGQNLPPILADRIMVQQVVMNLIRNGMAAMQDAAAPGRVLSVVTERSGAFVETRVSDQGSGIAPAHLDKIFTPFFTTKPDGMGMGLNICRSIIELHGGRLWADANAQGGAAFHFTLPLEALPQ